MSIIVTFGEIMLRLSPPGREKWFQSPRLEAAFGGGEANVAVSLARFGHESRYLTILPPQELGDAAAAELKRWGVRTDFIVRKGRRLGIYFAEPGANQRPSKILYDREASALAEARPGDIVWESALEGAAWLHVTGITPALSPGAADLTLEAARAARAAGVRVSVDLNYRSKLWKYGKQATEVMPGILRLADLAIGNEEDFPKAVGIKTVFDPLRGVPEPAALEALTSDVMSAFPNLERVAVSLRHALSADRNTWTGVLRTRQGFLAGPTYDITHIVDRIGSGDAFAAGLLHGLLTFGSDARALAFGVAAGCLKHSIPGDFNLAAEKEVLDLLEDSSGRIRR